MRARSILTRVDLWGTGSALLALAILALLSGREPEDTPDGGDA